MPADEVSLVTKRGVMLFTGHPGRIPKLAAGDHVRHVAHRATDQLQGNRRGQVHHIWGPAHIYDAGVALSAQLLQSR